MQPAQPPVDGETMQYEDAQRPVEDETMHQEDAQRPYDTDEQIPDIASMSVETVRGSPARIGDVGPQQSRREAIDEAKTVIAELRIVARSWLKS